MLTIVAISKAKPEHRDFVKKELIKLIAPTRKEKGCINYDLHEDNNDPNTFIFHENWQDRESFENHIKSEHIKQYKDIIGDKIAERTLYELTKVD